MIIPEFQALQLAHSLQTKAGEYDVAAIDHPVDDEAGRIKLLKSFLEGRLSREITPKAAEAINASTRRSGRCDAIELGRVLKLLFDEA